MQVWFTTSESHDKACWLPSPSGAGLPSWDHCMQIDSMSRRLAVNTFEGHCFGFIDAAGAVVGRKCVRRGVTEYLATGSTEDVAGTADWAQSLLDSVISLAQKHRHSFYRVLQVALLADALIYGARSAPKPGARRESRSLVLTTHHVLLAAAVITMLADHFAKGVLHDTGSILTAPAQFIGAPIFYFLAGANPRADSFASTVALLLVHAVLLEIMPLPGDIKPYTLSTIALIRVLKRSVKAPPAATIWAPLLHAMIAGLLVALEDFFGFPGLALSYGCRGLLWGAAGHFRAQSLVSRDAAGCIALPYELAALVVHLHFTLQNCVGAICRSLPARPVLCTALKAVTLPVLLFSSLVLHRYRYRKLHDLRQRPSLFSCTAYLVAHHSLVLYVVHLGGLIAYEWYKSNLFSKASDGQAH